MITYKQFRETLSYLERLILFSSGQLTLREAEKPILKTSLSVNRVLAYILTQTKDKPVCLHKLMVHRPKNKK